MTTKIVDIADELYREMGEPSDSSIASIAFWLRTNISRLNILINKPYTINEETLEISDTEADPFGINEKGIFKLLFKKEFPAFLSEKEKSINLAHQRELYLLRERMYNATRRPSKGALKETSPALDTSRDSNLENHLPYTHNRVSIEGNAENTTQANKKAHSV